VLPSMPTAKGMAFVEGSLWPIKGWVTGSFKAFQPAAFHRFVGARTFIDAASRRTTTAALAFRYELNVLGSMTWGLGGAAS